MRKAFLAATAVGGILIGNFAYADDEIDYSIHQDYISIRALGAGNSFTVIDDYNTLLYNPAGLARLEEGELNLGFGAGITSGASKFVDDVTKASKASESEKVGKVQQVLEDNYGKNHAVRAPMLSAIWARPKWGIGLILGDATVNLAIHQTGGPQLGTFAYVDNTLAIGLAKASENKAFTIGLTIKGVYRGYVGKSFNAFDLATNSNIFKVQDAQEGLTVDGDIGMQYEVPSHNSGLMKLIHPTFAFVARNVADYGFQNNMHLVHQDSKDDPPRLQRRFDVGTKWELPKLWVFQPRFMFDERDMGHRYWTFVKGLHMGFELEWVAYSWLRGQYSFGTSQGYFSGGFGAELGWFRLDVATYGEEIGTTDARKENRFYLAKMSLDF